MYTYTNKQQKTLLIIYIPDATLTLKTQVMLLLKF